MKKHHQSMRIVISYQHASSPLPCARMNKEISAQDSLAVLPPIMGVVFIAFLFPLHVRQGLGLGTLFVGLVAGSRLAAALLSFAGACV